MLRFTSHRLQLLKRLFPPKLNPALIQLLKVFIYLAIIPFANSQNELDELTILFTLSDTIPTFSDMLDGSDNH